MWLLRQPLSKVLYINETYRTKQELHNRSKTVAVSGSVWLTHHSLCFVPVSWNAFAPSLLLWSLCHSLSSLTLCLSVTLLPIHYTSFLLYFSHLCLLPYALYFLHYVHLYSSNVFSMLYASLSSHLYGPIYLFQLHFCIHNFQRSTVFLVMSGPIVGFKAQCPSHCVKWPCNNYTGFKGKLILDSTTDDHTTFTYFITRDP